ncbi:MAG: universal stress protein [Kiritimatiellia bacterium]
MIKSLLACTDGSSHGETAVEYGIQLAGKLNASLGILHVLDERMLEGPFLANLSGLIGAQPYTDSLGQFREIMQQKGEAVVAAVEAKAEAGGIPDARAKLIWGHPARTILGAENSAELIILGQDGEHDKSTGDWTGSTTDRVARHATRPVMIVPGHYVAIDKIMVAYDGSPHASRALREAIDLAMALHVPLVICTVIEADDQGRAMDHADTAMRLARAHECAAAFLITEGQPDQCLLKKAIETKCSLLIAGAHGHGRIREWIVGSTAHELIINTTLPLMLVR